MSKVWKVLIPVIILAGGLGIKAAIEASGEEVQKEEKKDTRPTVRIQSLHAIDYTVTIESYGEVRPLETTTISAQVSGEVTRWNDNFVAGGIVKRGDLLFSIEKDSYVAAKLQAESALLEAQAQLIEEQARADVAKREAQKMSNKQVSDLYLRKPQLLSAQAKVKSAEARLKAAQRDLNNTEVRAPYDALVISRDIGVGQFVNVGTKAATLNNIENAEITFPIAGFDNQYLLSTFEGMPAQVVTRGNPPISRQGTIARDLGIVDEATRMSNLVVRITDPYSTRSDQQPLKFGHYVQVSFDGVTLNNVYKIKQDLVNNSRIWLLDDEQKLVQREVNVVREEGDYFLIDSGIENAERLVLTLPEYPQNGMEVVVIDEQSSQMANRTAE